VELRYNAKKLLRKIGALDKQGFHISILKNPDRWTIKLLEFDRPMTWNERFRNLRGCGPQTYNALMRDLGEEEEPYYPKDNTEVSDVKQRASDVSLVLWAFKKIGNLERIERACKVALEVVK
jgi:hypothetical protein